MVVEYNKVGNKILTITSELISELIALITVAVDTFIFGWFFNIVTEIEQVQFNIL